ncbi:MAG TPA: molybdopterin oxidoreductase family protein [Acidobacteriota bacterium]|jgi:assimilatory nitrate reductase catalytic subunit
MAKLPQTGDELIKIYGPHLNYPRKESGVASDVPDHLVQTHCCFCGMQCGIQLKVKDNRVVGFEPWEEFPFNEGRLCPKGVQRYLQNEHPDRLLHPLIRSDAGFRPGSWDEAMTKTAAEIRRIQDKYGKNAFAMLSGVSLNNEKSYLVGKFARVALQTANLDYNGRLCMVSAGAGNKKAFGIDRAANPWSDLLHSNLIFIAGSNVGECFPTLTDYIWKARDRGARLIVVDPRETPVARTADLHVAIRPGRDLALMNAILSLLIQWNRLDHEFIAHHTTGFESVRQAATEMSLSDAAHLCGVPEGQIIKAAQMWSDAKNSILLHARGIEHHTKGVDNVLSCINLVLATGRLGRKGCGYGTITGQGNGQGGREHGHKCDQLPGNRDIENPEHRKYISDVWGIREEDLPRKGLSAQEIVDAIHKGEIRGLLSICFNPLVSLPDTSHTRQALEKLEFYAAIDFFLNETAHHADVVFPGSLHEEDDGTSTSAEARVIRCRKAVDPPGEARQDWKILCEIADRLGRGKHFDYQSSERIFEELRIASRGGTADYYGITYDKIEKNYGVFWPCPSEDHPGTPRLFEDRRSYHPDGKFHFQAVRYRPSAEETDAEFPVVLTTGRVVSQYLSGTQTRRIGMLVDQYPEPRLEIHPHLAARYGIATGDLVRVTSRRGSMELPALVTETIRADTVFIPYHWPGKQAANQLTQRALDPVSKIPEFKVSAVRLQKVAR